MGKIYVVLADADEEYIERFTDFLHCSEYRDDVLLQSYSHVDKFIHYVRNTQDHAVLLVCESWIPLLAEQGKSQQLISLNDVQRQSVDNELPAIYKYQPLNELIVKLLNRHRKERPQLIDSNVKQTQMVISIFSTIGGCGKTTTAINMVKQWSMLNKKVLYLNLEAMSSFELFMQRTEEDDFAKLLYYAKTMSHSQFNKELQQFIKYNPLFKCDYIEPLSQFKDSEDIEAKDIQMLVQALQEEQRYDVIIIDLDSSPEPRNWGAMEVSDHIVWLLNDDVSCKLKTKHHLNAIRNLEAIVHNKILPKIRFTLTKYTGQVINTFSEENIDVVHHLPYIPQWKAVDDAIQLHTSEMFGSSVASIIKDLQLTREEVAHG